MFWPTLLFALIVALILTAIFAIGLRRPGPWSGWVWFFIIVLLAGWMAAVWTRPVGPPIWGVAWIPMLWVALLFALLLAAATPPPATPEEPPAEEGQAAATGAAIALGAFFWIMLMALVIAVIIGYAV